MKDGSNSFVRFNSYEATIDDASNNAISTFRYFWRELAWDRRRENPILDLACVKIPFRGEGTGHVEQMWIDDVKFDGRYVSGKLVNHPEHLKSVKKGDLVKVRFGEISDWMYAIDSFVYGGFTISIIRAGLDKQERANHDLAWGLDFGGLDRIDLCPPEIHKKAGLFKKKFTDHLMALEMNADLIDFIEQHPEQVNDMDQDGLTLLHKQALIGSPFGVAALLKEKASTETKSLSGMTACELASAIGWVDIAAELKG